MKLVVLSVVAWLLALGAFLIGIRFVNEPPAFENDVSQFLGIVTLSSLAIVAVTVAVLYAPGMFAMRLRAWQGWQRYTILGGALGLVPGLVFGGLAGAIVNIDGPDKSMAELILSDVGLVTVGVNVLFGLLFGAGFFMAFVRGRSV